MPNDAAMPLTLNLNELLTIRLVRKMDGVDAALVLFRKHGRGFRLTDFGLTNFRLGGPCRRPHPAGILPASAFSRSECCR
jgi:hypothetical protein